MNKNQTLEKTVSRFSLYKEIDRRIMENIGLIFPYISYKSIEDNVFYVYEISK